MDIILIAIIIGAVTYFIYTLLEDEDAVTRRIKGLSSSKGSKKDEDEDEDYSGFLANSVKKIAKNISERYQNTVYQKQLIIEAGLPSDDEYVLKHISKKIMFAVVLTVFALFIVIIGSSSVGVKLLMLGLAPVFGFKFPDIALKTQAKKRGTEINYSLPDALDLLTICVEAGLGLDAAIARVAKEQRLSAPILSSEFNRVSKEVLAGVPRVDAFNNLLKRNNSDELRSFISLLIQADRFGTSISKSLKVHSDSLRIKRRQKAEELASKASVKMTIPLVLFILPATFIVILAPAAISMMKIFLNMGD